MVSAAPHSFAGLVGAFVGDVVDDAAQRASWASGSP